MKHTYATTLTRDYLEYLGITDVSIDGSKIMKGDTEVKQHYDGRYMLITLYDPGVRRATPKELRITSTGLVAYGVHRIVYCWYNRIVPSGMVIDHISGDKVDNRLENLQLLTPKENLSKERPESNKQIKCKLNKPRSFYEDKLKNYTALYEKAKKEHNAANAHKYRNYVAGTRARLRYYDAHIGEYNDKK